MKLGSLNVSFLDILFLRNSNNGFACWANDSRKSTATGSAEGY